MQPRLAALLRRSDLACGADGIYGAHTMVAAEQQREMEFRDRIAARQSGGYLRTVARNHSIPVMDAEVDRFLSKMPHDAVILDIGGCWGWHWRRLRATRPDVGVVIVDFARANLGHAKALLGELLDTNVALVHADATALPFDDQGPARTAFDGVWSAQVLQHIPDFARACREACRVLAPGGTFVSYSLHVTPVIRAIYRLVGRRYHCDGIHKNTFHLTRATDAQASVVAQIFGAPVTSRYTECLFHPDLRIVVAGREHSVLGRLDVQLTRVTWLAKWLARQRSFEVVKARAAVAIPA